MKQNPVVREHLQKIARTIGTSVNSLTLTAVFASAGVTVVGVAGAFTVHPVFWVVAGVGALSTLTSVAFRTMAVPRVLRRSNQKSNRITDAQVRALIDKRTKTITASRLSHGTNSSLKAAEEKLTALAVNGDVEIDVNASTDETVYKKKD